MEATQVAIVGAGPAGLVLSHLLRAAGIDSVVLESRGREYLEQRVRAGVLEQGTVELLDTLGLAERLKREGLVHHGILLGFGGRRHRIALSDLTAGRSITVYGQQEVVKDLIAARLAAGGTIEFGVEDVRLAELDTAHPRVSYRKAGVEHELACDFIAGCDGFHGVSRPSIPAGVLTVYERSYPFAWLGILAAVAPSTHELIYVRHERGFALHSLRSPEVSRLYLQIEPGDRLENWPDDRIWSELRTRLATHDQDRSQDRNQDSDQDSDNKDGWTLADGPILERSIALHHSFVVEPMQHGRLFLAGDAAHIVPPTGAKGLNLAVADVRILSEGIVAWYASGNTAALAGYSARCLARIWRVQEFSSWMSTLLHTLPGSTPFEERLAQSRLDWICRSDAAARSLAENYVGLPFT